MKLNIEIDLEEFYAENFESDEYGASPTSSLSGEIVSIIKHEAVQAIKTQVREEVSAIATKAYKDFGEKKLQDITEFEMDRFANEGMIRKGSRNNTELVSVKDYLSGVFKDSGRWNSTDKAMRKMGEEFAAEARKRYDMMFASNIVTGLEKQGLLKAGVFESLTEDSGS